MLGLVALGACKKSETTGGKPSIPGAPPPATGTAGMGRGWKCGDKKCDFEMGEDCMVCAKDCSMCDGCQRKVGEGCTNCKCEKCVCKKHPGCCKRGKGWGPTCVAACKKECGGCGLLPGRGPTGPGKPTGSDRVKPAKGPPKGGVVLSNWRCGDGKCVQSSGEDCTVCPGDCGLCDGCQVKVGTGCPNCKCEKCVCAKLPSCCGKKGSWGAKCVKACKEQCGGCGTLKQRASASSAVFGGKAGNRPVPQNLSAKCGNKRCELAQGEDCEACPQDCSRCNGCLPKLGPGCRDCKCATCVCKKLPSCCKANGRWSIRCVEACREKCGGCGVTAAGLAPPPPAPGKVGLPPARSPGTAAGATGAAARCGDGKCDPGTEDCIICARDCGNCDGCQAKLGPGCLRCKCEKCVCKKLPHCCKAGGKWDARCVAACKTGCGGCGLN